VALLGALLVGLPMALVATVGWPFPTALPTWEQFERVLTTGEIDSWTLVKTLALLVWLAWAQLTVSALAETLALAKGRRTAHVPSARPLRLAAANLVTTAALLFSSSGRVAYADPAEHANLQIALSTSSPATLPPVATSPIPRAGALPTTGSVPAAQTMAAPPPGHVAAAEAAVWRVRPRDTLWGIAERALGDGLRWREIHDLNVGRPQSDGGSLRAGDDHIMSGWVLRLPSDSASAPPTAPPRELDIENEMTAMGTASITVEPGDSLWTLADAHLDDPHRWPEIYEDNLGRQQPNGQRLTDPDLIRPGWKLELPSSEGLSPADPSTATDQTTELAEAAGQPPQHERHPTPWAQLDREHLTTPPASPAPTPAPDIATGLAPDRATIGDPAEGHEEGEELEPPSLNGETASWSDRALVFTGAGLVAAGVIATLDRLRRSRQRRRQPGQRIRLPDGDLAATEQRVRGLADPATADLLDTALRSLAATCLENGREVPNIPLVSVGASDVAVHLAEADHQVPDGWRLEDAGMTWVLPRPTDLEPLRDHGASIVSPTPLLITIGTHAGSRRRVLLNLTHAGVLAIDADPTTTSTAIRAQALELATSSRAASLQILLVGMGSQLAALERVRCVPDDVALELLNSDGHSDDPDHCATDATVLMFVGPPSAALQAALTELGHRAGSSITAVSAHAPDAQWRLTLDEEVVRVTPHGLELEPMELSALDVERIEQLLVAAAEPTYVSAETCAPPEASVPTPSQNGHAQAPRKIDEAKTSPEPTLEVRVLGPVEVVGAGEFTSVKAEELVVYLALHRHAADADSLQEALWPGKKPSAGRLHTAVWRARQAIGNDAEGQPHLPNAKHGRYQLSAQVGLDLQRFNNHISRAKANPDTAVQELRAALGLVRGRPLSATSAEYAWVTYDLHAIEQQISDAAHQLAELHLERDEAEQARWSAERGLLADPYCELLHRDLMLAAATTGNLGEVRSIMGNLRALLENGSENNDADDYLHPATLQLYSSLTNASASGGQTPGARAE
jgi:nucleoid-associated protein YgaU/DNA-binding SARP family transcriptional activator